MVLRTRKRLKRLASTPPTPPRRPEHAAAGHDLQYEVKTSRPSRPCGRTGTAWTRAQGKHKGPQRPDTPDEGGPWDILTVVGPDRPIIAAREELKREAERSRQESQAGRRAREDRAERESRERSHRSADARTSAWASSASASALGPDARFAAQADERVLRIEW